MLTEPKQPCVSDAAETAATTVAPPQHFGGTITIAAAVSADGIVAETNSHMHAPEPDPWSNVITNFDLAFATTAEPNDVSDHDFFHSGLPRRVWRGEAEAACDAEAEAA